MITDCCSNKVSTIVNKTSKQKNDSVKTGVSFVRSYFARSLFLSFLFNNLQEKKGGNAHCVDPCSSCVYIHTYYNDVVGSISVSIVFMDTTNEINI